MYDRRFVSNLLNQEITLSHLEDEPILRHTVKFKNNNELDARKTINKWIDRIQGSIIKEERNGITFFFPVGLTTRGLRSSILDALDKTIVTTKYDPDPYFTSPPAVLLP